MLQRAPIIRKAHGGDPLQDLVQLLLARGLKTKRKRKKRNKRRMNRSTEGGKMKNKRNKDVDWWMNEWKEG